jgi:hypothetical protein
MEDIIDSNLLLHKKNFTLHIGKHFAQITTTGHNFGDHLGAENEDWDFILAEIVGVNFILNHEGSMVDNGATF